MKAKSLLLMAAILMVVACGEKSGTNTDPKQNEVAVATADSLKTSEDLNNMPIGDKFYEGMLEIFCKKHYQETFKKQFKGLLLEDLVLNNDSTVLVTGPLFFNNDEKEDVTEETQFRATITRIAENKFTITFENKGEKEWSDTTLTINYIQMKKD